MDQMPNGDAAYKLLKFTTFCSIFYSFYLKVNRIRNSNKIHIWGSDISDPVENFGDIPGISNVLLGNISGLGYFLPTAVQMQAIPIMLQVSPCSPSIHLHLLGFSEKWLNLIVDEHINRVEKFYAPHPLGVGKQLRSLFP